jgi:hypothetical protein
MAMVSRLVHSDLFAGVSAAILLLLLVFALDVPVWLAVMLAASVYIGITLIRPQWDPPPLLDVHQEAYEAALRHLDAVRRLEPRIASAEMRDRVHGVVTRVQQVLDVMEEDGLLDAAHVFCERLVEPFAVLVDEYVRIAERGVRGAQPLLERAETHDLPLIEGAVDRFYERLHRGSLVELASHAEMLELNLESLNMIAIRRAAP